MPVIYEKKGNHPGTHALVIGISRYRHVGDGSQPTTRGKSIDIGQLSTAARSASEFAAWLLREYRNPDAPLASLRILLSPSNGEEISAPVRQEMKPGVDHAAMTDHVRKDVLDFRQACDRNGGNVAIVYVAGHGVQFTKQGAIVLLEDFGHDEELTLLSSAVDVVGLYNGMNHAGGAHTQFWFLDACRQRPEVAEAFENVVDAGITLDVRAGDVESSSLVFASQTRESALARTGQTSLFVDALLWALRGGAAEGASGQINEWHVSSGKLFVALKDRVSALARQYDQEQHVEIAQWVGRNASIQRFASPPPVRLRISLRPESVRPPPRGSLLDGQSIPVIQDYSSWPLDRSVQAGLYLLKIDPAPPLQACQRILNLAPLEYTETVELRQ